MDSFSITIIIALVIILIYEHNKGEKESVLCSNNDGQCYKISSEFHNPEHAVDELTRINQFNADFIRYLRNKYLWNKSGNETMRKITQQLINNYNPDVLKENNPDSTLNTSYVLEKGKSVAFCLREKDTGYNNIEDQQMLNFVNLHEISHLAMSYHDPNHGDEFWKTFKILLQEATEAGLYNPINWGKTPKKYCGLLVNYNPLYDKKITV